MGSPVEFRGHNACGVAVVGRLAVDADVAEFVHARYRRRWRSLRVFRGNLKVGGIGAHPDTGKRTWWAKSGDPRD